MKLDIRKTSILASRTWIHIGEGSHKAITGHKLLIFSTMGGMEMKEKAIVFGGGDNEGNFYNDAVDIHLYSL